MVAGSKCWGLRSPPTQVHFVIPVANTGIRDSSHRVPAPQPMTILILEDDNIVIPILQMGNCLKGVEQFVQITEPLSGRAELQPVTSELLTIILFPIKC